MDAIYLILLYIYLMIFIIMLMIINKNSKDRKGVFNFNMFNSNDTIFDYKKCKELQ